MDVYSGGQGDGAGERISYTESNSVADWVVELKINDAKGLFPTA